MSPVFIDRKCPDCDGTGLVFRKNAKWGNACPRCNGMGSIGECREATPDEMKPYEPTEFGEWMQKARIHSLTWTTEPPKVAGWYWCRVSKLYQPRLVEVYDSEDGLRFGSGDSWQEPSMSVESCGFEWAGPISPPIEI